MDFPTPSIRAEQQKNRRRSDPTVRKLLVLIYLLYISGGFENLFLPTNGLIMVVGLAILLFQGRVIFDSSYAAHYRWLVIATVILLAFTFINCIYPLNFKGYTVLIQSKYIGMVLYLCWSSFGLYCLLKNRSLPSKLLLQKIKAEPNQP